MSGLGVSVVVPTWRRAPWLERCLDAIACQGLLPEVVLVVGRPEDDLARNVVNQQRAAAPFVLRWLDVPSPGHVAPVRIGVAHATTPVIAFLDDDAEPERDWLGAMIVPFAEANVGCVGGRIHTPGAVARLRRGAGRLRWYGRFGANVAATDGNAPFEVAAVAEGNWAWRTELLKRLRFDPILDFDDASMYGLDLCLQARELGYLVLYEPRARVVHRPAPRDPGLDRSERTRRTFTYSRNSMYVTLKHLPAWRRRAFLAWSFVVGERSAYGFASGAVDLVMARPRVRALLASSLRGKLVGYREWRAQR